MYKATGNRERLRFFIKLILNRHFQKIAQYLIQKISICIMRINI